MVSQPAVSASLSVSVGSPRIQPVRQVRAPEVRSTPPRQERHRVEHNDSRELRPRFPRVKVNEPDRHKQLVHPVAAPSPVTKPSTVPARPPVAPQVSVPVSAPARPQNHLPQNAGRTPVKEQPQQLNPSVKVPVQSPVSPAPPQNAGRPFLKEQPQRLNPPAPAQTRSAQPDNKGAGQRIEKRVWRVNEAEPKRDKAPKAMEQKERERK